MCRCAYTQKILIQFFFLGVIPLFELRNLTNNEIKILLKTVSQCNSSETTQQNYVEMWMRGHNGYKTMS